MDIKEQVKRILERLDQAELANYDDYVDQIDELYKTWFEKMIGSQKIVINKGEHCEACGGYNSSSGNNSCSCVIRNQLRKELVTKLQAKAKK